MHVRIIALLFLLLYLLFQSKSFLSPYYFLGHDTDAHVTRVQAYIAAIKEGQFPVRYIGWAFNGVGSPLFNHYPVGFYTLVSFFYFTGLPLHTSFYGVVWLAWIGTGVGLFLLLPRVGIIAASFWWFSPYAAMDIYLRAAYPELLAICFAVWLLWSLRQHHYWLASLFGSLLLITHLPTTLLFMPILLAYMFRQFLPVIISGCLALGMAAFYLFPSLLELKYIQSEQLHSDFYDYQYHFLQPWQLFKGTWEYGYSNPGDQQDTSFKFVIGQWMIILIASLYIRKPAIKFWLAVVIVSLFFSLQSAKPLWDHLPFMAFIQYPWRTHLITTVAIAVLAGLIFNYKNKIVQSITIICLLGMVVETHTWFKPFGSMEVPLITNFSHQPPYPRIGIESAYTPPESNTDTIEQITTLITSVETSTFLETTVNLPVTQTLTFRRWLYPGWVGFIDNQPIPLQKDPNGLIAIQVPPGSHRITIKYQGTPLQRASNVISVISWTIFLSYGASRTFCTY